MKVIEIDIRYVCIKGVITDMEFLHLDKFKHYNL